MSGADGSALSAPFRAADAVLRGRVVHASDPAAPRSLAVAGVLVAAGLAYGGVMGSYSLNAEQALYAGLKVPLLLGVTFALSVPFFRVMHSLMGLADDFGPAVRALLTAQAGLAVVLLSLAPLVAFAYVSGVPYRWAILCNGIAFGVASFAAQRIVRGTYRPLIARDPRHRWMLRAWLTIYTFVGIQMGWVLRPFIGHPEMPAVFFRGTELGNAYVEVFRLVARAMGL